MRVSTLPTSKTANLNFVTYQAGGLAAARVKKFADLMLTEWALRNARNLMDAVQFARAGFELWEDVLRNLILEYKNQNREMPIYLRAYDMELTRVRYSRKSGRHRADQLLRNIIIAVVIAMVIERFGLRPDRTSSRRPSACSIVARALELEGMAMSEWNVVQVWKREGRLVTEIRRGLQ